MLFHRGLITLGIYSSILLLNHCTPPNGWKGDPYILPQKYQNNPSYSRYSSKNIVRVKIYKGGPLTIYMPSSYVFKGLAEKKIGRKFIKIKEEGMLIPQKRIFKLKNKIYVGMLNIKRENNTLIYVNYVPIANYLVSVAGSEMGKQWPLEALKAQVVVSRTYLIHKLQSNQNKMFDVDSTTLHQVYGGLLQNKTENINKAVKSTEGKVLFYRGKLAKVFFYSSCGGITASSKEVWREKIPYLIVQRTHFCEDSPAYKWKYVIPLSRLASLLRLKHINNISIIKRSQSKRVVELKVNNQIITAKKLRSTIGNRHMRSTLFNIQIKHNIAHIVGRGYGHGVGLCQWGTKTLAHKKNKRYKAILQYYFPRTSLRRISYKKWRTTST